MEDFVDVMYSNLLYLYITARYSKRTLKKISTKTRLLALSRYVNTTI